MFIKNFLKKSIDQKISSYASVAKNKSVLPSPLTKLVNIFIDEVTGNILTIDSDALVRTWSLESGECIGSYPIEFAVQDSDFSNKKKLTTCVIDPHSKHIAVAYDSGIV